MMIIIRLQHAQSQSPYCVGVSHFAVIARCWGLRIDITLHLNVDDPWPTGVLLKRKKKAGSDWQLVVGF